MTYFNCSTPYIDLDRIDCYGILSDSVKLDIFLRHYPDPQVAQIITDFIENLSQGADLKNHFILVLDVDKLLHHTKVRMIIKNSGLATALKLAG